MNSNYPALIVTVPLLSAFVVSALSWFKRWLCFPVALGALIFSFASAVLLFGEVLSKKVVAYHLGGWSPPWGIEYRVDLLNGLVLLLVSGIAMVNLIASKRSFEAEFRDKTWKFYPIYLLFVTGLLGVVITGDLFNLYVLLEITSLTAYAQIAMGDRARAPLASLNYVFWGVIGASFYLLGVGYLYIMTGSLNMQDVAGIISGLQGSQAVLVAFVFCLVGVWIKMAFFPLHGWLPGAYSFAPNPSARVIAPLMTKVMVYVMIRLMLTVFGVHYVYSVLKLQSVVVWLATLAIIIGSLLALSQKDLRKMLCFLIVSEIGYMVGGAWLGNRLGLTGAILHIVNDGLMTFCLFLAMGNIVFRLKKTRIDQLGGIFGKMPWTMAGFVLGGLSIIGIPPSCGFFSKWYLITGGFEAGAYEFVFALLFSSLVSVILFFRIFEIGFFEEPKGEIFTPAQGGVGEAPYSMVIPLLVVAGSLLVIGLYSGIVVQKVIFPFLQGC